MDTQEWALRSFESVIAPRGFAFVRASSARQALDLVPQVEPDAVIVTTRLDQTLPDFLLALRGAARGGASLPVAVLAGGSESRTEQVALLDAGAWTVVAPPFDVDVFVAQLSAFVRARRDAEAAREQALVDPDTALYSMAGLRRRAQELTAEAYRDNRAVTCIVIDAAADATGADDADAVAAVADALRATVRQSDLLARVGRAQFAVMVTAAEARGFPVLEARVRATMDALSKDTSRIRPSVGRATVERFREGYPGVEVLLERAAHAAVERIPARIVR